MEAVPDTPGQQTRNAVTQRIIAHVTRGWPRLGEPVVRHRGQFCYVAALLPGHREPTPILRLRHQGSADCWAIGIYLAISGQYTESEVPTPFGPWVRPMGCDCLAGWSVLSSASARGD